jgi:membrane-associated phospholipid phosphatase
MPANLALMDKINWALIGLIGLIVAAWIMFTDFTLEPMSALGSGAAVAGLLMLALFYRFYRPDERIETALSGLAQIVLFSAVAAPLSYCLASLNYPLWDATFHQWDMILGLNWRAYLDYVNAHPVIGMMFNISYISILPQMAVAAAIIGLSGKLAEVRIFVFAVITSGFITILISGFTPAMAMFVHLGLSPQDYPNLAPAAASVHINHMTGLREGTLRLLVLNQSEGIITFPSYHAALGLIMIVAFWAVRWLRWPALVLNLLMIAATPIDGGHYFVDVIAGLIIAAGSLWMAHYVLYHYRPHQTVGIPYETGPETSS